MRAVDEDRTQRSQIRRFRLGVALAVGALPLLVAGCGASSNQETVTPRAPATTSQSPATELTIVIKDDAKVTTWTLSCDPPSGTHPDPDKACAAVLTSKATKALPPVAKGMMCTQIFGGSQTATISGRWDGNPVNASFSRQNGCEISRWQAMGELLPKYATGGPGAS
jgi:hypothetical protein